MPDTSAPTPTMPRLLITAGPTHEPIDAVRFIGNRSSGRMGCALVEAAIARGWTVTLLLGPGITAPDSDSQSTTIRFQTAADLAGLLRAQWPGHDVLIMAAAVADYRPVSPIPGKHRRGADEFLLHLEPVPDLLAELAATTRPDQIVIGFALEPAAELEPSARAKLARKRVDGIVANPLETMESTEIHGTLLLADGRTREPGRPLTKRHFADWLLGEVISLRKEREASNVETR